jgi:glycosyltransferase involved in cell wall biosynthesis
MAVAGPTASERLRILQIVGNAVIGGAENHVLTLVQSLRARGHLVAVVCPRPGPLVDALLDARVPVHLIEHVVPAPDDDYSLSLPALWALSALMRRWRPTVVHSHLYPAHLHGTLAGQLAGVPVLVATAHTLVVRPGDPWLVALTRGRIIAVSRAAKALLVRAGVPPRRIRVIYNGIAPQYFQDATAQALTLRQQLGIPTDAPVVGIIARLSAEKGHQAFLYLARDVAALYPPARFVVVGTGPLADELEALAARLGIAERVLFTGARRDITALNHAIDIFALPSREEALPLAVLEAMAAGRPVVASAVGGVPEVVVDGETGFLLRPDDHSGFVRAVATLLDRPALRARMGARGRARVRERFGVDRMVDAVLRYYRTLLAVYRRDRHRR